MDHYLLILMATAMTASVIEDIRRMKIPNLVTLPTILLALTIHALSGGFEGFLFSTGGLITGMAFFIVPYIMGGMGAGDVKLMGAAGAILGPKGVCVASIMVYATGGVYGLVVLLLIPQCGLSFLKRIWATARTFLLTAQFIILPPDKNEKQPVLRYAIPIAVGTIAYMAIEIKGYDLFDILFGPSLKMLTN